MAWNVKHPNTQGLLSALCSCVSIALLPMLAFIVFQRFSLRERAIAYSSSSMRLPIILLVTGVAGLLALIGFGLGIRSMGQVRNDHPGRSWLGFVLGAFGMVMAMLLFLAFYLLKEAVI